MNATKKMEVPKFTLHVGSSIKKVIAVTSGKGGVGKSTITALLAAHMKAKGFRVGVMDADITGPSIAKLFGVEQQLYASENGWIPLVSKTGIPFVSMNALLDEPDAPVLWRGPLLGGIIKQFWGEVEWGDLDVLFIDMPPGTGDVALTVFQSLPIAGVVLVTTPQTLVDMIVGKSIRMVQDLHLPILGLVENMAEFVCPDCGKIHRIFGQSHVEELAKKYSIDATVSLPLQPEWTAWCDSGDVEFLENSRLESFIEELAKDSFKIK